MNHNERIQFIYCNRSDHCIQRAWTKCTTVNWALPAAVRPVNNIHHKSRLISMITEIENGVVQSWSHRMLHDRHPAVYRSIQWPASYQEFPMWWITEPYFCRNIRNHFRSNRISIHLSTKKVGPFRISISTISRMSSHTITMEYNNNNNNDNRIFYWMIFRHTPVLFSVVAIWNPRWCSKIPLIHRYYNQSIPSLVWRK